MMSERVGRTLSSNWATFLIAVVIASPIIYWGFDRSEPVTVLSYKLVPSEVYPGGKIVRELSVRRKQACVTEVDLVLIDGARVRWIYDEPVIASPGATGVIDNYSQPMTLPKEAAPGKAELRTVAKRICNPLHHIWPLVTNYPSIYFTILDPR